MHDALEQALCEHLRVSHLSLVANGTMALMLCYRALQLSGEVITTPLTSPATVNSITWCGLTPVFADVDPEELTLDPAAVERAITPHTSAIVGVHLYGMPCQVDSFRTVAERHNLRLIYDGAHAFGTEIDGESVSKFGDATTLSFHATKLFNTAEGGAVVTGDPEIKRRIDLLKTLGIQDEVTVALPGINARMNELEAAFGLANLAIVESERSARAAIAEVYLSRLYGIDGLEFFTLPSHVRNSHHYFVIRVVNGVSRLLRDELYERLKTFNVFARRYFYPLCSEFSFYRHMPSSAPKNLPNANCAAAEVLCLPFYGALGQESAHRVCDIIGYLMDRNTGPQPTAAGSALKNP
ncbi:MAG TPA: DegT/DnrJ/EryC1/StrS family aminotransferase [Pseudolabrys sp.]|nr:DegT/DnrJ/EryC1/StrS family aminotransferase [Pseudolabrys sp.]